MRIASGRILLAVALLASAFALLLPGTSQAALYNVTPCGGSYDPCTITATRRTPTADQLVGFNNQLFLDYYKPLLRGYTGTFSTPILDSNNNGYIIGRVSGPNQIHTQFIFHEGKLLCCFTDEPFTLYDINENNDVVGWDIYTTGPFLLHPGIGREVLRTYPDGDPLSFYWHPLAIDDNGNILARCISICGGTDGYFELRVSEPGSLALLASMIAGLALWPLRRHVSAA